MKLLLAELWPEKGHFRLLIELTDMLSSVHNVSTIIPNGSTENNLNHCIIAPYGYYSKMNKNRIVDFVHSLFYMHKVAKYIKSIDEIKNFDYIILITYNEVGYFLFKKIFKEKVILMNHNNIDFISKSTIKKALFMSFAKKTKHIVQTKFIFDYLNKKISVNRENIAIWLHPLNYNENVLTKPIYDCVGISNSNDDAIIKEILELEKETGFLKKDNLKILLRSRKYSYDDGYLKIINGFLPDNEYNFYINSSSTIFLPFPKTFKYRMSGTLVDAFSNRKPVISSDTILYKNVKKVYPSIIKKYTLESFSSSIKLLKVLSYAQDIEFNRFYSMHCRQNLSKSIEAELNRLINYSSTETYVDF